jgi:hypothetical protein
MTVSLFAGLGLPLINRKNHFTRATIANRIRKITVANNTMAIPSPAVVSAINIISGSEIREKVHLRGVRLGYRWLVGVFGFGSLLLRLGFHGVKFEVGEDELDSG